MIKLMPCLLCCCLLVTTHQLHSQTPTQTDADSYTRYELLAPGSHAFRIIYDISATTPGALFYYNTLRQGSEHKVDAVIDLYSGDSLRWEIVDGSHARSNGHPQANAQTEYLKVYLPRPVPKDGEIRLRIDKTYTDSLSYFQEGDRIFYSRSLSIPRNAVVLPVGYELTACNYPSQVEQEADGRLKVSFMHAGPASVPYRLEAKPLPPGAQRSPATNRQPPWEPFTQKPEGRDKSHARLDYRLQERAFQDREIVYFLQQPETHDFRLYHDYTESRPGVDKYINVVRAGSRASNPSAYILDTGEKLRVETLRGQAITQKKIDIGEPVTDATEVVVIWFDPVKPGHSTRLRIWETYTDPLRYLRYGNELVWDRSFGRNRNTVILPPGWYLTLNAIPAVIDQTPEGQIRLHYVNDRPDNIDVLIKGLQRKGEE